MATMRKRTSARTKAKETVSTEEETATNPTKKVAGSVKAERQPELPNLDKPQKGGGVHRRVDNVKVTGFENIVDSIFTFDTDTVYEEVLNCLELQGKASRAEYGMLVDALDAAEENARKALQLVANAKVALGNYVTDVEVLQAELHEQSVREYMSALEDPTNDRVTKKPTKDDIQAYKVANYHDEVRDMNERVNKAKRSVEYLEGLAGLTAQKARDLRQMVASSRGA